MRCFRPRSSRPAEEGNIVEKLHPKESQQVSRDVKDPEETRAQQDSNYQLSRIMRPDDTNIVGNVHGGIILKMIEEAGCIVGTRHCNTQNGDRCLAALVRVEKTEFLFPMFVGEVAHVTAEITYTSKHSLEVQSEQTMCSNYKYRQFLHEKERRRRGRREAEERQKRGGGSVVYEVMALGSRRQANQVPQSVRQHLVRQASVTAPKGEAAYCGHEP
ncbi:Cytosolic acyl coenzyme A thioester hydrolase [Liparis tanakae]|uniref:Cytosolic acyl coenzyme A thioester hydrolase n=1 Tax=Liparis tanakae TaxID=230148 RepID=A0A4Z2IGJ1_9TELE|nr:Cytosolic acyl coenzyme A thioester hydrolase [Liparis tanakae]